MFFFYNSSNFFFFGFPLPQHGYVIVVKDENYLFVMGGQLFFNFFFFF